MNGGGEDVLAKPESRPTAKQELSWLKETERARVVSESASCGRKFMVGRSLGGRYGRNVYIYNWELGWLDYWLDLWICCMTLWWWW